MEGQCLSDEFAKCDLGSQGEVQMMDTAAKGIEAQWEGRSLYSGRRFHPGGGRPPHGGRSPHRGRHPSYRGKKTSHNSKAPLEGTNGTTTITKLCELKEYSQLGEHRNSVLTNFNDLYGAKGRTITKSLMEIFHLNEEEEIILFITQKFLHIYGLCVPCFKFSSPNSLCSNSIKCKWCHHYSHTDQNSDLNPHKMLHMRNKCKVCSYLYRDGFCSLQNECRFCHSVEHLPSKVRQSYFRMLNDLYEKKKHTDVITKELLYSLQQGKSNSFDGNLFVTMEKELMCMYNDIQGGDSVEEGRDNGTDGARKTKETCPECDTQGKKPCSSYFLLGDAQTSCMENGNCPDCHSEAHKKKNSSLYFMTYLHDRNLCQVCPNINEENCPCKEDSAYCHDTDHISYGVKMKNVLGVCEASLRGEFSDEHQPGKAAPGDNVEVLANVADSVSIIAESSFGAHASNLSADRQDHRRSHRMRSSVGTHSRPPNMDAKSNERKKNSHKRSTHVNESSKRYAHSRSHSKDAHTGRRRMHKEDLAQKKNDTEMETPSLATYTKQHIHHLGNNLCDKDISPFYKKDEEHKDAKCASSKYPDEQSDIGTHHICDSTEQTGMRHQPVYDEADCSKGEEQNVCTNLHLKMENTSSHFAACTEMDTKGESKNLITGKSKMNSEQNIEQDNAGGKEYKNRDGCSGTVEEGMTNPHGQEVNVDDEHIYKEQNGSHCGKEYDCGESSGSTNVEKCSNNEGADGSFEEGPPSCTSPSNKRVDSLSTQETKYHLNDLQSLSKLPLDDIRNFHDEGQGEEDIEIQEPTSRVKIIQDVPTHNAQRPRVLSGDTGRGVSTRVSRGVSRGVSRYVSRYVRVEGHGYDKGYSRNGYSNWNHVEGKTWRRQKMMTRELTGGYSIEEHNAYRCIPCAFYFTTGCNYSLQCRNCHHEEHRNTSSYLCYYKMLHRIRKCKPCVEYFRGTCKNSQTGTPREMDHCAYCHDESHRKDMEKVANGRARRRSISSQSTSGSKQQWRSASRSAIKPKGQVLSSSRSTLESKSITRSSSLSTLASKQKLHKGHRSPSGMCTKINSNRPNKSALSDSHKKSITTNEPHPEEKMSLSNKSEDEQEDSKVGGTNGTLSSRGGKKYPSNGNPNSTKEEKEATERRTPKHIMKKIKEASEDDNWRSMKDVAKDKKMPNGRYHEVRHVRRYSSPERASSRGSSQLCGSQSDDSHRSRSPDPGKSEKRKVITDKEEAKSWRRKQEPIKPGTYNLSGRQKLMSRHDKGACHPCVYYFIGFYGCSNGKRCLNCHHEDHRNPHTLFHPSRLLHVKKLCVPCANYFKGDCTRPMHACVYCHNEAHARETSWETGDGENGGDATQGKGTHPKGDRAREEISEEDVYKEDIIKGERAKVERQPGKHFHYVKQVGYRERDAHDRGVCHPCTFFFSGNNGCLKRNRCPNCHNRDHADIHSSYHPSKLLHYKGICYPCIGHMKGTCKRRSYECVYCHNEEHLSEDRKDQMRKVIDSVTEKMKDRRYYQKMSHAYGEDRR
ncbi:hypothetical protein AK88_01502 [Plasmodium fragile]|uniref:C3H1-type domain-containing protein n=1 Tax=Plasmodium fragile TaxID=5857 RepID=A0A0D9QPU2_PLAFR|nr:uncharacterized protein AK88_01502 [Plasmodium fragile]KJP88812.1 hypothetical protein AK88_01502 [Plasmodium fragile]